MVEPIDPVIRTCSSCEYSWRASAQTSLDELSAKLQKELDSSRGVASRDQIREVVLEVLDERSKEAEEEDDDPEVEEIENDLSWDPDPYPPAEDPEVDVELEQVSEIFGRLLEERIASAGSGSADS